MVQKVQKQLSNSEEGFTLIEVLVTALVLVGFLLGGLQAITLATLLRVQAQRKTEAINWIQNDETKIKYRGMYVLAYNGTTYTPDQDICDTSTYANLFRNHLISSGFNTDVTSITLLNDSNNYSQRTYTPNGNVLRIQWQVWDEGGNVDTNNNPDVNGDPDPNDPDDRIIATVTSEVVASAVFACN